MRRLLSILLLAAFALPVVAPLLALGQDPDAGLPACCRRHGQHHCTMFDVGRDDSAHRVVAVCPVWPQRAITSTVVSHHFTNPASAVIVALRASLSLPQNCDAPTLISRERLHPKRGPPTRLLA